jgi:hypothetical protein
MSIRWLASGRIFILMSGHRKKGPRVLRQTVACAFKTHYLERRAAVAKYRILMQIQFSDHTGSLLLARKAQILERAETMGDLLTRLTVA